MAQIANYSELGYKGVDIDLPEVEQYLHTLRQGETPSILRHLYPDLAKPQVGIFQADSQTCPPRPQPC